MENFILAFMQSPLHLIDFYTEKDSETPISTLLTYLDCSCYHLTFVSLSSLLMNHQKNKTKLFLQTAKAAFVALC